MAATPLQDRQLYEFSSPFANPPLGKGSLPTYRKTFLSIIIYGTLNDTGKVFICGIGTDATPL